MRVSAPPVLALAALLRAAAKVRGERVVQQVGVLIVEVEGVLDPAAMLPRSPSVATIVIKAQRESNWAHDLPPQHRLGDIGLSNVGACCL